MPPSSVASSTYSRGPCQGAPLPLSRDGDPLSARKARMGRSPGTPGHGTPWGRESGRRSSPRSRQRGSFRSRVGWGDGASSQRGAALGGQRRELVRPGAAGWVPWLQGRPWRVRALAAVPGREGCGAGRVEAAGAGPSRVRSPQPSGHVGSVRAPQTPGSRARPPPAPRPAPLPLTSHDVQGEGHQQAGPGGAGSPGGRGRARLHPGASSPRKAGLGGRTRSRAARHLRARPAPARPAAAAPRQWSGRGRGQRRGRGRERRTRPGLALRPAGS